MTTNEIKIPGAAGNPVSADPKKLVMQAYPRAGYLKHRSEVFDANSRRMEIRDVVSVFDCVDLPIQSRILLGRGFCEYAAWVDAARHILRNRTH